MQRYTFFAEQSNTFLVFYLFFVSFCQNLVKDYILPRRYYEFAGDVAAYSLATDWDRDQVWAVIKPFLNKYGKAKISDLEKLVGSHVSEKQMRSYLDALRKDGRLKTEGKNKYLYYVLGKGE